MNIDNKLTELKTLYNVVDVVELDHWHTLPYPIAKSWLDSECCRLRKEAFDTDERIIFVQRQSDVYVKNNNTGLILHNLQTILNKTDISNFFIIILSNNPNLSTELTAIKQISNDSVPITGFFCDEGKFMPTVVDTHPGNITEAYQYSDSNPIKISLNELSNREQDLLTKSKVFCIYPWNHLHAWPTGQAFPCCHSEHAGQVGDTRKNTLKEIWNDAPMRQLRVNMLTETPSPACTRCYEQDDTGFFSGRKSANKHHGHLINRVLDTKEDGTLDRFEMTYWDIRFSNLCNLSCRSCGHIFSSGWYQDQAKLAGGNWKEKNTALNYAGRTETDMWKQLIPHLDYVEQIYFAGGEPLMMAEHYNILDELERRGRFDVRLIYNTNFTHTRLKDRTVFDYWKKFKSVAVGASLDAMGPRAEYIRKGTDWALVERNREQMLETCPNVDFYISPTLSIMNALHLPDFHRNWVDRGFIRPQDLNVNILQDPEFYRIDVAPSAYKKTIEELYLKHIEWLEPLDRLGRATTGFKSAVTYLQADDKTYLIDKFWSKTNELDTIRKENILEVIPELQALK